MTAISQALSHYFDTGVRRRGADYFRGGRVRLGSGSAAHVLASVRGSSRYQIELRREDATIHASCTCPYFDVGMCKHIWAVLLAVDARRLLEGDGGDDGVRLVEAAGHDGDDDDTDALGFGEDDELDPDGDPVPGGSHAKQRLAWASLAGFAPRLAASGAGRKRKAKSSDWRERLAALEPRMQVLAGTDWLPTRELLYVIDVAGSRGRRTLHLEIFTRDLKKDGTPGKPKSRLLPRDLPDRLENSEDRRILAMLTGAGELYGQGGVGHTSSRYYGAYGSQPYRYRLLDAQAELVLPAACATGRCLLRVRPDDDHRDWLPVAWEEADPWRFVLEVRRSPDDTHYELSGSLRRGAARMDLAAPVLLVSAGFLFTRERAARYEHQGAFDWIAMLSEHGPLRVPVAQRDEFTAALLTAPVLPPLELPAELRYEEVAVAPRPCLAVKTVHHGWRPARLRGRLSFDYGGTAVAHGEPGRGIVQAAERRVLKRDPGAEQQAWERLQRLGWRSASPDYSSGPPVPELGLTASRLPDTVRELVAAGWRVEAEGKPYRSPAGFDVQVSSGIDWFELRGTVEFGDQVAHLPELLAAARRGEQMVKLGDGSFGLLPEEWLARYGFLAGLGTAQADHLRFGRSQIGLLDVLLAAQPEVHCDELFARAREELGRFAGIRAADPPAGFEGTLRPYQKEGLGWFDFLRQFGFGGCLADDMGLGKTVQVLALLEARRVLRARAGGSGRSRTRRTSGSTKASPRGTAGPSSPLGPSLVVAPKSLIFNWMQEAARFTPKLRVLDHTGPQRQKGNGHFNDHDVVLTTYGTVRSDIAHFKDTRFDYVVLDEAQTIKNASSASAKAARLLQADHRLALSGTPVENHVGELWSLFEFLNPGMLGAASVFKKTHGNAARTLDEETRQLLARALRPFLLRRTKEQVVRDLPPKLEQTLYCELERKQRADYDKLRDYYRGALLKRVERDGIKRAKLKILEALLRLRQAAIHPGLIDKQRADEPSAKLDMLLHRLQEVLDEGHKTLVFSQFTGMLAILRSRLDGLGIAYEYLDGKTRNRDKCVARFQTDADCRLFLISLKAGGLGLNLTAAQYVFLLDPWWNPAVEAQAIDRAHRIGQANRVFAYRLIARDTIEEKVLQLQNAKRELADAIVGADNSLIRTLGKEDLELLLG
jgi:superfamily II DNA or RNA helicase